MGSSPSHKGRRGETGQTLILFVFAAAVLIGIVALVIDVGQVFVERRQSQNAVDAAALAGAAYLPTNPATAIAKANQYLALNGMDPADPNNSVTITTPYQGNPNKIEVQVSHQLGAWFGGVVGVNSFQFTSRAVAERVPNNYALFQTGPNPAGDDDDDDPECDGELELEGNNIFIDGDTHADGEFEIEADNSGPGSGNLDIEITGAVTFVCEFEVEGTSVAFGSGPTQLPASVPPPVSYNYSDFGPCDFFVDGDLKIDEDTPQYFVGGDVISGQLIPGVYCATGDIKLDDDHLEIAPQITGNVTFVAHGEIKLEHDNLNLTAFQFDVLAFTDGCEDNDDDDGDAGENPGDPGDPDGDPGEGEIEIESNNVTFTGMLLAACGEIELEGDSITSPGALIIGQEIEIEGNSVSITAGDFDLLGGFRLVE